MSVIIPCYLCEETISRAVDSVLSQSVLPAELWLVDDSSPDAGRTLDALQRVKNACDGPVRVEILQCPRNLGPGETRNQAWERTSEPYVAFLDADDAWHPKKLEIQYEWMRQNPDVIVSGHRDALFGTAPVASPQNSRSIATTELTRATILSSNPLSMRTVMIRSDSPHRFPPNRRFSDDYFLWLSVVLNGGRAVILEQTLAFHFRPHFSRGGVSAALWDMERGELMNYLTLFQRGQIRAWEMPLVCTYSLLKYARRIAINTGRHLHELAGSPFGNSTETSSDRGRRR